MSISNWKGVITFGLVTIPVILYPSQNKKANIVFHQIDRRDNARIKYQRINSDTGKEVPWKEITRGYEFEKGTVVPVPDAILKKVAGEKSREINIEHFINLKELNLLTLENVYYLVPDKNSVKGYVILRDTLAATNKAGVAKVIISTKEHLSVIFSYENALILCLLRYHSEIKKLSDFDFPAKDIKKYKVTAKEMSIAKQLIQSMTSKWHPEKYKDDYQDFIHQWAMESINNLPHKVKEKQPKKTKQTLNFVDLLKKSLASSQQLDKRKKLSGGRHGKQVGKSKYSHPTRLVH
jgi:DNA end-binding protein Ku